MKKLILVAVALAIGAMGMAQDTATMHSGPWQMRRSTGDKTVDRFWFIMDRTLNAAEADAIRGMFRRMGGGEEHTMMKAILNAIDSSKSSDTSTMNTLKPMSNGMSDIDVYYAMDKGLSWTETGVLHRWLSNATVEEMNAVSKLVQTASWANSQWSTSGMGG
jgi:hypothetical protein